jgi:DNA-binding NtrC family response regulator
MQLTHQAQEEATQLTDVASCAKSLGSVLDYIMPNLNGLDLYKRLKDIDPSIRALFLTASHEELNEHENPRQDQLNFVGKPIAAEKLLWEIDSMLNQVTTPVLESTIIC